MRRYELTVGLRNAISAGACAITPGDEVLQQLRAALVARAVGERVGTVLAAQREVQVEARAGVAVERLAHERGEQALARREVLDRGLEAERAVGGVERGRVGEVDLPLAHAVLVGGRRSRRGRRRAARAACGRARRADRCGRRRCRRASGSRRSASSRRAPSRCAEQVELELGAHDRLQAERLEPGDRALQRAARVGPVGLAVGRLVGQAPGHLRRPRQLRERLGQRRDVDVAEAVLEAGDDVVAQVDRRDRLAELEAPARRPSSAKTLDRHVLAAQHAVQIG